MARLLRTAAAFACVLAVAACGDAEDETQGGPTTEPSQTTTPTRLYIGQVVRTEAADSGCLGSIDKTWKPDANTKTARLCGVQNGTETWFTVNPATMFEATVTTAEASLPETSTTGDWVIQIQLDEASVKRFGRLATKLLSMPAPDPLALVVDGKVVSAPVPTPGIENLSKLQIGGPYSREEAEQIAASLSGD